MAELTVRNLQVSFPGLRGESTAVDRVSFAMGAERLGIVGESGSGKSMTARALLGLVRSPGRVSAEQMTFDGIDMMRLSPKAWRAMRGSRIGMILQDPKYSLNPVQPVMAQIVEVAMLHGTDTVWNYHGTPHSSLGGLTPLERMSQQLDGVGLPPVRLRRMISPAALATLSTDDVAILDVTQHVNYVRAHIPSAWFVLRSHLRESLAAIPPAKSYVLTCTSSRLALYVQPELQALVARARRWQRGLEAQLPANCLWGRSARFAAHRPVPPPL
jgi:ABC-type dipeptide/oligopeptide/nickel transport system ATPase component